MLGREENGGEKNKEKVEEDGESLSLLNSFGKRKGGVREFLGDGELR